MSTEHPTLPEFFKKGCCAFLGLEDVKDEEELDPYWKISRRMLYQGLLEAFEVQWTRYIPKLKIPSGFSSWLNYAEYLANVSHKSIPSLPSTLAPPSTSQDTTNVALGLTGEMGHGKSTVALYLCQRYGYGEYSFANPLKEGVKQLFSFSDEQVYGEEKNQNDERWGVSPRYILQQIGTELFRNHLQIYLPQISESPDGLWIRNFLRWFELHPCGRVVISDCRFIDECDALHRMGMKIYRVVRPMEQRLDLRKATERSPRGDNPPDPSAHASEKLQKRLPVDGELSNEGTLEQLYCNVDSLLLRLNERTPIYAGYDIHAYTSQLQKMGITAFSDGVLSETAFRDILEEMEKTLGPKPAYVNFRNVYRAGFITDPELPHINVALVLETVWKRVTQLDDPSIYRYFSETLDQIGMTCIQGISHRLYMDYQALCTL